MEIVSISHRGLRRLVEADDARGVPAELAGKLRVMITLLLEMQDVEQIKSRTNWRPHMLTGNRKGYWSLTVSANWRLTFRIDEGMKQICELNFEDYH